MRTTKMTWRPKICKILQQNIIPPEHNNTNTKWAMIQEHNDPNKTTKQQHENVQKYIQTHKENKQRKTNNIK